MIPITPTWLVLFDEHKDTLLLYKLVSKRKKNRENMKKSRENVQRKMTAGGLTLIITFSPTHTTQANQATDE